MCSSDLMTILPPMPSGALTVLAVSLVDGPNQVKVQLLLASLSAAKAAGIQLAVMAAASRPAANRRARRRALGEWLMVFLLLFPALGAHPARPRSGPRLQDTRRVGCIHPSYNIWQILQGQSCIPRENWRKDQILVKFLGNITSRNLLDRWGFVGSALIALSVSLRSPAILYFPLSQLR